LSKAEATRYKLAEQKLENDRKQMPRRGLVIGKFYPPHRGHKFLIDTARVKVDELSLIICHKPGEKPSGELRAGWLREIHPDVRVILVEDLNLDPDDSALWARCSIDWLGFVPEMVFTSEDYGDRFAECLGSTHVMIDRNRKVFPISGTRVRVDPLSSWEYLELPVREYYAKRICLVGAESTGKTQLARALAEYYRTDWVPEFGREISELKLSQNGAYAWQSDDFVNIAQTQCRLENEAARRCHRILFCDTDAFATSIWHLRYMGFRSTEVDRIAASHRVPDLYLLTDCDTPFVQDGTRDGESIREWMHKEFVSELVSQRRPFKVLSGSYEERLSQAIECVEACM
jgi:NadR type nicotinamide-nucleotide adenylyltransferase